MSLLQGDVLPKSVVKNVLRQRIYSTSLDYFCSEKSFPTQTGVALSEDIQIMLKFWTTMHQDRKHIKTSAIGDLEGSVLDGAVGSFADNRSVSSEFPRTHSSTGIGGWTAAAPPVNAVAMAANVNNIGLTTNGTLSKRSVSRQQARPLLNESFVKDYTKKRWLILALLSVEIEALVVHENPLETRESLVASLGGRDYGNTLANVGKQFDDAMKFLEEVRLRLPDRSWREYARNSWDISPALAVFLAQRLNSSPVLEREVSRLVRSAPEEVLHLPRALDFFLTKETLENDAKELPCVLTWSRCSPVRALSLLCPRTLPSHPLTAQYAVRVLSSYPAEAVLFYIPQLVQATR